ncbi:MULTISPECIES: YkvA family protein [Thermomonospora]|uniref:Putative membrane protein n=1 Tax=Thermomonospora cellulosilytica TaxID=1411118 RepID=A0A7W3N0V2_9ACTN|nr:MULTISPECIES: YkvA family protein [Thermomonospora]MBA9005472.1 putative membrane protein [Thermomonospora cellulosilytica]
MQPTPDVAVTRRRPFTLGWSGLAVLLVGAVLAFVVRGDVVVPGYALMAVGVVLLAAGLAVRRRASALDGDRTSTGRIVAMIAAAVYIISPLDIVPDVLLPVGVIDDATAFTWLVFALGQEFARRRRRRLSRG